MVAAFAWEQAGWLVVVIAVAAGLAAYGRSRRRGATATRDAVGELGAAEGGYATGVGKTGAAESGYATGGDAGAATTVATETPLREAGSKHTALSRRTLVAGAWGLLGLLAAGCIAAWLANIETTLAHALLGLLGLLAVARLAIAFYRQHGGTLSPFVRGLLTAARLAAWMILLMLLARPVFDWVVIEWQKPLLVVLLDQSESMAIADAGPKQHTSRAELADDAIAAAHGAIGQLDALYEVRVRGVGAGEEPLSDWRVAPKDPLSALSAAVRDAGAMRSGRGQPPRAVVLLSDGGENVAKPGELREAAVALASQGTALLAAGVGPPPGATPLVELDPLALPARIGLRDRLRVPVAGRVLGSAGSPVAVNLLWDGEAVSRLDVPIERNPQRLASELDLSPPAAGVHRLTVRVTMPRAAGAPSFEESATIDVNDDRVRVLWVEETPRVEAAFVARALQAESQIELTRRFLFEAAHPAAAAAGEGPAWGDYDVVVLGGVSRGLSRKLLDELAAAVTERGVGLLLAGGRGLFNDGDYEGTALAELSPVSFRRDEFGLRGPVRFIPTAGGLSHPALRGVALPENAQPTEATLDERPVWLALPPLGGAALLGRVKPAAATLGADEVGHPLLVAQEVGRGRCAAAGWESTWAWALASDEGGGLNRRMWRQLIIWLANRRPHAWVLTDQSTYPLAALLSGQQRVKVRAGVSGLEGGDRAVAKSAEMRLVLVAGERRQDVALERHGEEWTAEITGAALTAQQITGGDFALELTVRGLPAGSMPSSASKPEHEALDARTRFGVAAVSLEAQPPTANLALLRSAAEATASVGGSYSDVAELPKVLDRLARTDQRQEVRTRVRYGAVEREPWVFFGSLLALLTIEWAARKRLGLA